MTVTQRIKYWCLSLAGLFLLAAVPPTGRGDGQLFVVPPGWAEPSYDLARNPLRSEVVDLGRKLFFDPGLSQDGTVSCATCHNPSAAFAQPDHALSHGIFNRSGTRNSPALFNLAWETEFMWDGRINHLDAQPLAPLTDNTEMGNTLPAALAYLRRTAPYPQAFRAAFGDTTVTTDRFVKAFSQFMLTLQSYNSPYDRFMRQEPGAALSVSELNGLLLFRENCTSCHTEPLFTNHQYKRNGLAAGNDRGRANISQRAADSLRFKVPSLRNVQVTAPYMHDGRFNTLREVLDHYTSRANPHHNPASEVARPITLHPKDKDDLVAFLNALTDRQFIREAVAREQQAQP